MRKLLRSIGPFEAVVVVGGLVALGMVVYVDLLAEAIFERTMAVGDILPELISRERVVLRQTKLGLALLLTVVFAVQFLVVRRRRLELERLSRHHELVLRSAEEAIFALDVEGRVTVANEAAATLTGYSTAELVGRRLHDLVQARREDDAPYPFEDCPTSVVLRGESVREVSGEVFWRADGSPVPVDYSSNPIWLHGEVVGVVQVARDVTDRRAMERMKDEFVSVISHELRTPLTSIHGALGLLAGGVVGELPERARRMVAISLENTERLIRLINDILDIERLESGSLDMRRESCEMAEIATRAVEVMQPLADQAEVEIAVDAPRAHLRADPDRILQVLTNLLSNAIKFSPAGSVVRLTGAVDGGTVRVVVVDEGRGIPEDKLETIFGRFQQVDASDSREKGGTGLGLAICRHIVQQHGGHIWAESGEGPGSRFNLELPAATAPAVTEPAATAPAVTEPAGPTVLVCDDDPAVQAVVGRILADRGLSPMMASSGEEALVLARRHRPAALVLDLLMPGLDGWQTAAALREDPATSDIPIIVLSVLTEADAPAVGRTSAWLDKAGDIERLVEAVDQVLAQAPREHAVVVVVEDDASLATVLVESFQRFGLQTYQASSGSAALELCARVVPDLVILDVGLAEGDGFTVVEGLRQHSALRLVPLVVYTARDLGEDERDRLRLGDTRFFTKSRVSVEEFEAQVVGLLERIAVRGDDRDGAGQTSDLGR